jgi:hypothetical protein
MDTWRELKELDEYRQVKLLKKDKYDDYPLLRWARCRMIGLLEEKSDFGIF